MRAQDEGSWDRCVREHRGGSKGSRGAPENGDLRGRRGCGWLYRVPDAVVIVVVGIIVVVASSTTSLQRFAANVTPLRLFQQDTHVYIPKALLRGIYIIRSRLNSNIMNHARPVSGARV